jgi:hypothetical protein
MSPSLPPRSLGAFPTEPELIDTELMGRLVATMHPDVRVESVDIRRVWQFGKGEQVSTAGRIDLTVTYSDESLNLPTQLVVKVARPQLPAYPLYRNEVAAYTQLRPDKFLTTPQCVGGWFDHNTGSFGLALEDLTTRGATFVNVTTSASVDDVKSLVLELARLHARFWGVRGDWSSTELSWAPTHVKGEIHDLFTHPDLVPAMIADEVAKTQFKRELLQSAGQTTASMKRQVAIVQDHQTQLPNTLCHGDMHVGNSFRLPDGSAGVADWQLSARGYYMHDLAYAIVTSLDVEARRAHEQSLISLHLDELARLGATGLPTFGEAFDEYRRAIAWAVYIGWLTCPLDNYGWEISVGNHVRLLTAYRDLDTTAAVAAIS